MQNTPQVSIAWVVGERAKYQFAKTSRKLSPPMWGDAAEKSVWMKQAGAKPPCLLEVKAEVRLAVMLAVHWPMYVISGASRIWSVGMESW